MGTDPNSSPILTDNERLVKHPFTLP